LLGYLAGVNELTMAALRAPPHLLEEFGLSDGPEEDDECPAQIDAERAG